MRPTSPPHLTSHLGGDSKIFGFCWLALLVHMDGLARMPTKKYQPSVFPVPSKVIKGQSKVKIVTLRVRIPISRWALIKMDDQATHRFSRTIWPKNAMVGKMRAAQLKFLVEPCSCERDTACPGTRNRRGWQEFPCGPRASKTPAADLLDVWAFQLSPLRVWIFLAKPIKHSRRQLPISVGELQREPISPASLQGARIFSLASVNTSTRTKIWNHCKAKLDYMDSLVHHVWELMFWSIRCGFLHIVYSHSLCSRIALITAVSDQSHDSGVAQKKSSFCTASWWHGDTGHAPNGIGRNWTEMPLFTYVQIKIAGKFM